MKKIVLVGVILSNALTSISVDGSVVTGHTGMRGGFGVQPGTGGPRGQRP